jgi:hypothetical protein
MRELLADMLSRTVRAASVPALSVVMTTVARRAASPHGEPVALAVVTQEVEVVVEEEVVVVVVAADTANPALTLFPITFEI